MNAGKISNSMLKRSVFKRIQGVREEVVQGAGIGLDSSIVAVREGHHAVFAASNTRYSVYRVCNNLCAAGAEPVAVMCSIIMPVDFLESQLKDAVDHIQKQCDAFNIQIAGGHTEVSSSVLEPVISVTGIGTVSKDRFFSSKNIRPDQDVIMTKWIGIEGVRRIIEQKKEEILKVYTESFLENALGDMGDMSVQKEAVVAANLGVCAMHDAADGGIFAALWDMAEAGNVGLEIDFKQVQVKQEIIEICELFEKNPYELLSSGCLLMTDEHGCDIVKTLQEQGICAAVIGRTTSGKNRVVYNEGETRFLEPPKRDEIYSVICAVT